MTFEYCATVGSLLIVYTLLILCRYNTFSPLRKTMSDISVPCMVFSLIIFIKDVQSYTKSFRYVSLEWYRSFPIPYVFLVCSLINGFMSILVAVLIGPNFPIPSPPQITVYQYWFQRKVLPLNCASSSFFLNCFFYSTRNFSLCMGSVSILCLSSSLTRFPGLHTTSPVHCNSVVLWH